jgi:hypothetical protein
MGECATALPDCVGQPAPAGSLAARRGSKGAQSQTTAAGGLYLQQLQVSLRGWAVQLQPHPQAELVHLPKAAGAKRVHTNTI